MKWYISGESDATVFEENDENTDFKLKTRHDWKVRESEMTSIGHERR